MDITAISDLHGHYPNLEGGDLLIVAGDLTKRDEESEYGVFFNWCREQDYEEIIVIGGNHDNYLQNNPFFAYLQDCGEFTYLCDSGTEFEGLKIWGSPWTKTFEGMNPRCKAFTVDTEEELDEKWNLIPDDIDILITHSPPFTILDKTIDGKQVGSTTLMAQRLVGHLHPKLWVWGHIHEAYGKEEPYKRDDTRFVNASHVNERYQPINPPIRINYSLLKKED